MRLPEWQQARESTEGACWLLNLFVTFFLGEEKQISLLF